MQVTSPVSSSTPGAIKGNKAAPERRIRRLEKKRDELQQKLAGVGGSGGNDSGGGERMTAPAPPGRFRW